MLGKSGFSNKILIFLSLVRIKNLCLIAECPAGRRRRRVIMEEEEEICHDQFFQIMAY